MRHYCAIVVLLLLTGCERPTKVSLALSETGSGIVFRVTGNGSLGEMLVYGPEYADHATSPSDRKYAIWQLEPDGGYLSGRTLDAIGEIAYGTVPAGYKQVTPAQGSPEMIVPGQTYYVVFSTVGATGFAGFFHLRNGKTEFVHLNRPCFTLDEHRSWKRVPCFE